MKDLRSVLKKLLEKDVPGFVEKTKEFEILDSWSAAVGEKIASNAWPVRMIDHETLLVASGSNTWIQQLKYLEPDIIKKLGENSKSTKRVKKLKFKLETESGRKYRERG